MALTCAWHGPMPWMHLQVLPGKLFTRNTFPRGEGVSMGAFLSLPDRIIEAGKGLLGATTEYRVREVPDRPEVLVVACDMLGNPLMCGGHTVTAVLQRYHPAPPSRGSSISSVEKVTIVDDDGNAGRCLHDAAFTSGYTTATAS